MKQKQIACNKENKLKACKQAAVEKSGRCLSAEYTTSKDKLKWECNVGHQWHATPFSIFHRNSWCPECSAKERGSKKRYSLEFLREIAHKKEGECLSSHYFGLAFKYKFKCKKEHIWDAWGNNISSGSWCPYCAKESWKIQKKISSDIQEIKKIASQMSQVELREAINTLENFCNK